MIEILNGGMLSTIQDKGRIGYQRFGVPVSGPMDWYAAALANRLVGNTDDAPLLEITIIGPTILLEDSCRFALTGAAFPARLDGQTIEMNTGIEATGGNRLTIGNATSGARGYLAFCGGLVVAPQLGSVSTYTKARLGGLDGTALKAGDRIALGCTDLSHCSGQLYPSTPALDYSSSPTVRIVVEDRTDHFDRSAIDKLTSSSYHLTHASDRMGYRLEGPQLAYSSDCDGNIISEGVTLGSIQVIDRRPVILMADHQTIGGYAKIATAIRADIPLLAQLRPGDKVRFTQVTTEEAQRAYLEMRQHLEECS
ncbi:MAG: biotin-dependent carboxyltransferase family protein [Actinomycetia bacterium]|nr:biotin-dependent carboxyltransferase family protein [Actinomycetes bacterium]